MKEPKFGANPRFDSPSQKPGKGSGDDTAKGCFKWGCGFPLAAIVLIFIGGMLASDWSNDGETADDAFAIRACRDEARDQLKNPSSADFWDETATDNGGNRWSVSGSFSGENSFGATTSGAYACTVTVIDGEASGASATLLE